MMRRNFILFVIVTVVIVIQDCALAEDQYACCSENPNSNDTACCLSCSSQNSNCSSLNSDFKSFNTTERAKCLFRTTTLPGVSASTETTPNTVTFEDTTVTESLTTVGVEEIFTICVLQCPLGYYENNQNCYKCDDLCENCTLEGDSVKCLVCRHGMNSTGHCCPRGTQEKLSGNMTICKVVPTSIPDEDDFLPIIIGCAVGGVAVICILVVVVVCCLRRRSKGYSQTNGHESGRETRRPLSELLHLKRKKKDSSEGQLPSIEDLDVVTNRHPRPYENTATIDHRKIAIGAQQEQDKKGRYIRDPTEKNKKTQKKTDHDEEPQEVYENQPTINIHTQQSEFHKKKGPFNKLSKKFKPKKGNNDKHGKPEPKEPVGAPTEEYEEVNPPAIQSNMPTETYEDVGSNQPDFPQEVYEDTAQTGSNDDLPQEEYTAMDPSTQQPTEEYLPMKVQSTKSARKTKPTKVHKTKTEEGTTNQGFNAGESIYANVGGDEGHYQNLQSLSKDPDMPEEDYQNYQAPLSK